MHTNTYTHRLCRQVSLYHLSEKVGRKKYPQWTKASQTNWKVIFMFDLQDQIPLWFLTLQCAVGKTTDSADILLQFGWFHSNCSEQRLFSPISNYSQLMQDDLPGGPTQLVWKCAKAQLGELNLSYPPILLSSPFVLWVFY